ncbi:MAG: hypothetical protein M3Y77_06810 [Actinomycetota bacterium]|nr:hypothetical protein [Actinomycetota bacterium]
MSFQSPTSPSFDAAPAGPVGLPLIRAAAVTTLLVAITVCIAGTFAPWLRSGSVARNSYQLVGALERFQIVDSGAVVAAVGGWPYFGPALMAPLLLVAFRCWRWAAAVAILLGILGLAAAMTALVVVGGTSHFGIELASIGPETVGCGSALLIVAGALLLLPDRWDVRVSRQRRV